LTEVSDWRARLTAVLDDKLDEQTRAALEAFTQIARSTVKRLVIENMSDALLKVLARPTLRVAYAQFLYACGVPYEEPSAEFIDALLSDLIAEIRLRRSA
jgi:hypothetical protein